MARKSAKRYELFAREYVVDLNGTRAAIAAGYSENGASSKASQLLATVKVKKLVDALNTKRSSKLEITAQKIDEELARLAFSNMRDFVGVGDDGKPQGLALSEISRDNWAAVQEIREDTTGGSGDGERKVVIRTTLKLADKTKNLELLGRRLGLFQDNVKVTGLEGLAERLTDIRKAKNADVKP